VASLNLHCGFGIDGQPFDVAAGLCQLEADVICIQESWLPVGGDGAPADDPLEHAAAKLGAELHRVVIARPRGLRLAGVPAIAVSGELAIAVLTTLPTTGHEIIDLGLAPSDDVPRFGQAVTLTLASGTRVRVVNTHLTHRLASPLQLRTLRRRLRTDAPRTEPLQRGRVPTIVVGDLNMPRSIAALSISFGTTVRGRTWPANRPLVQLDHILVDQSVKVIESAVLPAVGSDHLPVRARLRVLPSR
jgi:endonuclease/exonuclease/phosphatase family metal-dependent hydrolase